MNDLFDLHSFTPNAFLLVGLTTEVIGGYYLARGTILSPTQMLKISWPVWGPHPGVIASHIKARIDGVFGLIGLLMGYLTQTAGYLLTSYASINPKVGLAELVWALFSALVAGAILMMTKHVYGKIIYRRLAVEAVRSYKKSDGHSRPNLLASVGNDLGWPYSPLAKGDNKKHRDAYLWKTFKVTPVSLIGRDVYGVWKGCVMGVLSFCLLKLRNPSA